MKSFRLLACAVLFLCMTVWFGGCAPVAEQEPQTVDTASPTPAAAPKIGILELEGRRYRYTGDEGDLLAEEDILTVRRGGTYRLRGVLQEGRLRIRVGREETVHLLLEEVSVTSTYGIPLEIERAACVILETVADSVNLLTAEADSARAGLAADCTLILQGTGSLIVSGRGADGIRCGERIVLRGGRVTVSAKETAVLAERAFIMEGGTLTVPTATRGIVSTRPTCSDCRCGRVEMLDGAVTLSCDEVAIRAGERISIVGGQGSLDAPVRYRGGTVEVYGGFLKRTGSS